LKKPSFSSPARKDSGNAKGVNEVAGETRGPIYDGPGEGGAFNSCIFPRLLEGKGGKSRHSTELR